LKSYLVMFFVIIPPLFSQEMIGEDVAIVKSTKGDVRFMKPGVAGRQILEPFQWHHAGIRIITGSDSEAILVFLKGVQYRILPNSVGRLTQRGLFALKGKVELVDQEQQTLVTPISHGDHTPGYSGAVRIRSIGMSAIYPTGGARQLANTPKFMVETRPKGLSYQLQIEDQKGQLLLDTTNNLEMPMIPGNILKPGGLYYLRVRVIHPVIHYSWVETSFTTLTEIEASRHHALTHALDASLPNNIVFSASYDRKLGLQWEANEKMGHVLDASGEYAYNTGSHCLENPQEDFVDNGHEWHDYIEAGDGN